MSDNSDMPRGRPRKNAASPRHFIGKWVAHRNWRVGDLADAIGRSESTLTRLIAGDTKYVQETLEAISKALNVPEGYLLSIDPDGADFVLYEALIALSPGDRARLTEIARALNRAVA